VSEGEVASSNSKAALCGFFVARLRAGFFMSGASVRKNWMALAIALVNLAAAIVEYLAKQT